MPEEQPDEVREIDRLVKLAVSQLREHADGVQIFVTKTLSDGEGSTWHMSLGAGNWYARYGLVRQWMLKEEGLASRFFPVENEEDEE